MDDESNRRGRVDGLRSSDASHRLTQSAKPMSGRGLNIRLVAVGAAAPYFYMHRRGGYAARLEALANRARARKLGLWKACPHTQYDPYHGIQTRR